MTDFKPLVSADTDLHVDAGPFQLPERIGRYRVAKLLGKGGFGLVFLAHDEQLKRAVAVKVPHAERITAQDLAKEYLAEAQTVANLDHPTIVPVYDIGSTAEFPCYIVAKFIEGTNLAEKIKEARLSFRETAELVATVAEALQYAHQRGLVHRDVKPGNILIDQAGKPFVVDFGLALQEVDVGKGPRYAGTPGYMSPEQARGEGHRVDGRSDIFSLGVVFYELLTGRRPFRAESKQEMLDQIISHEPRPPRQYDDAVPKELERICLKMLSKRATERYTTAKDLSDDLRVWLAEACPEESVKLAGANVAPILDTEAVGHTPRTTPPPDSRAIKIVPKGLRSFDEHDADFFLELLPGPRDRDGLPDSIRFWKTRIEEADPNKAFSVGLIYGPSGCGKSSIVKAGLLPRLSDTVISVYIEAAPEETETRLLKVLRQRCPAIPDNLTLKDALAALRRGQGIPLGSKVLIIIDQFEQWLHAKKEEENTTLVQALRQCDGEQVQCIVMVRDDFWMAATRFMRELEVCLVEGHNSAAVDLFHARHAEKVLSAFGRAFGVLPDGSEATREQKQFLEHAIHDLAEDGKIVCVRLALFAEMMKGKAWTPTTLREVGGTQRVAVTFLEETFSTSTAPPEHRYHQTAARAVLKALLPESGIDIKGNMRSYDQLLEASGYVTRRTGFDDLIKILDSEIRLITPTDPEGVEAGNDAVQQGTVGRRYYQLTHDYLVPPLRDWLTRKQKETRRGRAELRLAERAALWNGKPENRLLPSLWELQSIRLLTNNKNWTEPQRKMMKKAKRVHGIRSGITAAVLVASLLGAWEITGRFQAASLVNQLLSADIAQVPGIVEKIDGYRRWADPLLRQEEDQAKEGSSRKLHVELALLPVDATQVADLRAQLLRVMPSEFPVVREALGSHRDAVTEPLWSLALNPNRPTHDRFQAACALATYAPKDERWIKIDTLVAGHLVSRQASEFLAWREALHPAKEQLIKPLGVIYRDPAQDQQLRIYATETLADYASDHPDDLFDLLADAERFQFHVIFDKLNAHKKQVLALAQQELGKQLGVKASEGEKESLAKRQANGAVTLYRLGDYEALWPHLKHSPDPTVRTNLIHWLAPLGGDPQAIVDRLDRESDVTIRRALVLTLGAFTELQLPSAQRQSLIEKLLSVFENEPDGGLHGAVEWLLRKWEQANSLQAVVNGLKSNDVQLQARKANDKRQWYINTQGQTFVLLAAGEFSMGSPATESGRLQDEGQHPHRIGRSYAISAHEVTKAEFRTFQRAVKLGNYSENNPYVRTDDSPQVGVTWYEAAQYCNWLSEQDGIPEGEWFYEPNDKQKYGPGMKVREKALDLRGYRLPTESEWENACRAQTTTSRFYGLGEAPLATYAWYLANGKDRTWPVATVMPNDNGLFDMLGNVAEWCHDRYIEYYPFLRKEGLITDEFHRAIRGGAFNDSPAKVRSAARDNTGLGERSGWLGIRVARTYP